MRISRAADRGRPGRRWARGLLLIGFVGLSTVLVQPLAAETVPPGLDQVTTANGYKSVVLDFDGQIFGGTSTTDDGTTGSGDLSFTVIDAPAPSTVTKTAGDVYTLTFGAAVEPHSTVITVDAAYDVNGESIALDPIPVPFAPEDLAALVSSLQALPGLPAGAVDLPFVRGWFADNGLTITDLMPGLADLSASGTEADLVAELEALSSVVSLDFNGRGLALELDQAAIALTPTMTGAAGVETSDGEPFDVALDGRAAIGIGVGGTLSLDVGADVTVAAASDHHVVLSADVTYAPEGRLGIVDVRAPGSQLALLAQVPLTCSTAAPCLADFPGVGAPTGSAYLTIPELQIDLGGTTPQSFTGSPVLSLVWTDLGDLTGVTASYDASTGIGGFTSVSVNDVAGGLQWIANWLVEVEKYGDLGAELPVVGGAAGELADLSGSLSGPTLAIGQLLGVIGDVSAQDLLLLCDPNGIGAKIDDLGLTLEDLQVLLPDETATDRAALLAMFKAEAVLIAGQCNGLLDGIGYDAAAHAITYTVGFRASPDIAGLLGSSLDLEIPGARSRRHLRRDQRR